MMNFDFWLYNMVNMIGPIYPQKYIKAFSFKYGRDSKNYASTKKVSIPSI